MKREGWGSADISRLELDIDALMDRIVEENFEALKELAK